MRFHPSSKLKIDMLNTSNGSRISAAALEHFSPFVREMSIHSCFVLFREMDHHSFYLPSSFGLLLPYGYIVEFNDH